MVNSKTRLVLGYAIKFTIMNVHLDSFQRSVHFFLYFIGTQILNYFNFL